MLFTGKGDGGTTKTLRGSERIPKNHSLIEALGAVDELNAWIGYCRSRSKSEILLLVQENLFSIQAKLAGAEINFGAEKIVELETIVNRLEAEMPPIKSFLIGGESEIGSLFDIARTVARRAERAVIAARGEQPIDDIVIAYLNRLSSLLYAFTRFSAHSEQRPENAPSYR
jgi:cob(I)alamin adenosyltransferase